MTGIMWGRISGNSLSLRLAKISSYKLFNRHHRKKTFDPDWCKKLQLTSMGTASDTLAAYGYHDKHDHVWTEHFDMDGYRRKNLRRSGEWKRRDSENSCSRASP